MSDINPIQTQQARTAALAGNSLTGDKTAAASGLGGGLAFFDMIFSQLTATLGTQTTADQALAGAKTTKGDNKDDQAVDPLLALLTPKATQLNFDATAEATPALTPAQKKLNDILDTLLQGLPENQKPVIQAVETTSLKQVLKDLKIDSKTVTADDSRLIATGLTPEELTALIQQVEAGQDVQVDTFVIGTVKLVPSENEATGQVAMFIPQALVLNKPAKGDQATLTTTTEIEDGAPDDDLAAALNMIDVGAGITSDPAKAAATPAQDTTIETTLPDASTRRADLNAFLKLLEDAQGEMGNRATGLKDAAATNGAASIGKDNAAATPAAGFKALLNQFMDTLTGDQGQTGDLTWSIDADQTLHTPATVTGSTANLITATRQAGEAHPTTHVIAATLTKAAQNGENKTLTLQLDPPELGRVEIQMHFTKDKSVKAHMVFEKPETMMMMQRDAQVLDRALMDAGMDAGSNDLSFELASQNHDFGDDRGGRGGHGGNTAPDAVDVEITETTMTWYVDENTGLQRYNILA